MTDLGSRIKKYERSYNQYATPRTPLMIRVDGKSFHTFTRKYEKPFDMKLISGMLSSAISTAKQLQGFKVAYIQSDEVTFLITDYDNLTSNGWFDYRINKINSITASYMSSYFNNYMNLDIHDIVVFDCRAFNVPKEDVVNAFLWRALDWKRNSLQMYAHSFFSHKELNCKKQCDIHDMLHDIGENWNNLTAIQKNGTFIINNNDMFTIHFNIKPNYEDIENLISFCI